MPLFVSDEEFSLLLHDGAALAERADAVILDLRREVDVIAASAEAASITAEQTSCLLEQKYISLSSEFSLIQSREDELRASLDQSSSELAQVQTQKQQLSVKIIEKDGEIGRLATEVSELHKSKRQLIELVERKDSEINEKNVTIKSYLDKIVNLTDNAAEREARLNEGQAELARSKAACARLSQEKELIDRHNTFLNDELKAKVDSYNELRRKYSDTEAEMSSKVGDVERQFYECSTSLKWNKDRVRELEIKLKSLQEELYSAKDSASKRDERLSAELSTVNRLMELYKLHSEEWSKKAGDLEGVIKALETRLTQVQNDNKEKLEREVSARQEFEKEAADLNRKLEKCEAEIEASRRANESNLFSPQTWMTTSAADDNAVENDGMPVPRVVAGVSGTALAASLLRNGWSLAKMYSKYQEAVDALRLEQLGRQESEAVLQRILSELEERAESVLDERVEHERMVEAYSLINQKLQISASDQQALEKTIQEMKTDIRKHERDYNLAQKDIADLQKEVTVLLEECRDVQIRCSSSGPDDIDNTAIVPFGTSPDSDTEKIISERFLTFKDINGLVEQNVKLRNLVRNLADQIENEEQKFKEKLEIELKKHMDEAALRVAAVLKRAEEQGQMIECLHTSVAMYRRLYEEELSLRTTPTLSIEAAPEEGRANLKLLLESSQETAKKTQQQASERLRCVEEKLENSRIEIASLRSERDKLALEANFSRERLDSFMKEFEQQKKETNGVLARNIEFSQIIVDYQRKLRENSESVRASEELSRKFEMEASILKHEKDMLVNAEKRALDEVRSLSERVYRLQASLDTIQSTDEVREEARSAERRKQKENTKQIQREWAEARQELEEERNTVRSLTLGREKAVDDLMRQVEELRKDLENKSLALLAAEARATSAEAKLSDMENKIKSSNGKEVEMICANGSSLTGSEVVGVQASKEIEKLRNEAQADKNHMLEYKKIAQASEEALTQIECAHENYKVEAEKLKRSLETEAISLRERVSELEKESGLKSEELVSAVVGREEALSSYVAEINNLKEEISVKASQIMTMEIQISCLREDLEKEHQKWRASQSNYERHVMLLSESIQNLNKTSEELGILREEASGLRKLVDEQKNEINEIKLKWETEKAEVEESKNETEKKYHDLNEQNKILHRRLEALHIQLAEKERLSSGLSSGTAGSASSGDAGLQNVINYLRRSREIAETEVALLKQEKLRLQSQLENALKSAETAESSLRAERSSARSILYSQDEINSLRLQINEINLLRESNARLREENKHNFDECQKLREITQKASADTENLDRLLKESQIEVAACKKEIEIQKIEKENLEKRASELLDRCKNIDVDEYNRLKDKVQKMQEHIKDKDSQLEEKQRILSEKEESISRMEQSLSKGSLELVEREKKINDTLEAEASLKSELERQKKITAHHKRKHEASSKEKDELDREKQALTKQVEELKQAKRGGETSGDQAMKEEKDTKIQILEKHLERLRDELKAERGKRLKNEKLVKDSYHSVEQEKSKFVNELEKHKEVSARLCDELEKLRTSKESLPESTSLVQQLPGTNLDDLTNSYASAVENFEKATRGVSTDVGTADSQVADSAVATTRTGPSMPVPPTSSTSTPGPAATLPAKSTEETEKRLIVSNLVTGSRKFARLPLRRPVRPEEPQGDIKMSEPVPSSDADLPTQTLIRKRQAFSASIVGSREESTPQAKTGSDFAPLPKKSKGSDTAQEGGNEVQALAITEKSETLPIVEDSPDLSDLPQASNKDATLDTLKEKVETEEKSETDAGQIDSQNDENALEETLGSEDIAPDQAEIENQTSTMDTGSVKEEGAMEGTEEPELAEAQPEPSATPTASPSTAEDEGEIVEETDAAAEETAEVSEKSSDGADQALAETEPAVTETLTSPEVAARATDKQSSPSATVEAEVEETAAREASPVSGVSTTINLTQRAQQRAMLRKAGVAGAATPAPGGRGRVAIRARGARGRRGARGSAAAKQP